MKTPLIAVLALVALPALAQGSSNNNPHANRPASPPASTPPPAPSPVPDALVQYRTQAEALCPAINANSTTTETTGYFSCECAAGQITQQAWDDYTYSYTGPFMTEADAKLIVDSLKTSPNMSVASSAIYNGMSPDGQSVLSACFSK